MIFKGDEKILEAERMFPLCNFFSVCNSLYDLFSDKSKALKYDGIKSIIGGENGGGGI